MCKVFGYCRISRKEQSIERQIRNIKAVYPDAFIVKEAYTGTKVEGRKELEKLLRIVKAGDTIVFDSVSRMSRNAAEGFALYQKLFEQGVTLEFLKEPQINTETYKASMDRHLDIVECGDDATNDLINTITEAINRYTLRLAERQIQLAFDQAEKEVKDLQQRTKEGIRTVKIRNEMIDKGVIDGEKTQIGQAKGVKLTTKKSKAAKEIIFRHSRDFIGTLQDADVIKLAGISRNSFYKYKRELVQELQAEA